MYKKVSLVSAVIFHIKFLWNLGKLYITSKEVNLIGFKFVQCQLKTFAMLNCDAFQYFIEWRGCDNMASNSSNFSMHCPICPKHEMFGYRPGLNTSTCKYLVVVIKPPTGNRK